MEKRLLLILIIASIDILLNIGFDSMALADEVQDEFEGQQFLFLVTEGYNQEECELQVSFTSQYMDTDRLDIICELFAEFEREKTGTSESHETEFYVVPAVAYKLSENFEIGLGVPSGLTNESYDWGVGVKVQYEW
jgi:hypothetical protein